MSALTGWSRLSPSTVSVSGRASGPGGLVDGGRAWLSTRRLPLPLRSLARSLIVCGIVSGGCRTLAAQTPRNAAALTRGARTLAQACNDAGVPHRSGAFQVEVLKGERLLRLRSGDVVVKEYRVGLGGSPVGDKLRRGDNRTPEGRFFVCTRNAASVFVRFLGLSYPDRKAAGRGLREGLIGKGQHAAILASERRRRQPPWNTALGGAVGIHGSGSERDWTLGCVAVDDAAIKELFPVLPLGTTVVIRP